MSTIAYHLSELRVAQDPTNRHRVMPTVLDSDKAILDIGCGVGQTFLALDCLDRICVGMDVDEEAIKYGIEHYDRIQFILADAKHIPFPAESFDLVYSRVTLPLTNIPKVLKEIHRVLRKDGRVWMTLHCKDVALMYLQDAINTRSVKRLLHVWYILINGYVLKWFGVVLPFITGRYESWQSIPAMQRLLVRHGFEVSDARQVGWHMIIEGRRV